jgi:hypothetical protein
MPLSPEQRYHQRKETGWNGSNIPDQGLLARAPTAATSGLVHPPQPVNYDAGYDGLGGPLLGGRGAVSPQMEASLEAMLAFREREIRGLKAKNRELAELAASEAAAAAAAASRLPPTIGDQCADLRATLALGQAELIVPADGYLDGAARKQRRQIKKRVKAALEQVAKLRADTADLATQLTGEPPTTVA